MNTIDIESRVPVYRELKMIFKNALLHLYFIFLFRIYENVVQLFFSNVSLIYLLLLYKLKCNMVIIQLFARDITLITNRAKMLAIIF